MFIKETDPPHEIHMQDDKKILFLKMFCIKLFVVNMVYLYESEAEFGGHILKEDIMRLAYNNPYYYFKQIASPYLSLLLAFFI